MTLNLFVYYNSAGDFWVMDISDASGNPLVSSVPLLTGVWPASNLLMPYAYMGIGSCVIIDLTGTGGIPDSTTLGTGYKNLWSN